MIFVIIILVALMAPLVVGSVFVCVPKWWTQSVVPRLPGRLTKDRPTMSEAAAARWRMVAKVLLSPILFSLALAVWLIRGWFSMGLAAIEGACPYNGSFKWRDNLSQWFDVGMKPLSDLSPEDVVEG